MSLAHPSASASSSRPRCCGRILGFACVRTASHTGGCSPCPSRTIEAAYVGHLVFGRLAARLVPRWSRFARGAAAAAPTLASLLAPLFDAPPLSEMLGEEQALRTMGRWSDVPAYAKRERARLLVMTRGYSWRRRLSRTAYSFEREPFTAWVAAGCPRKASSRIRRAATRAA